MAHPLVAKAGQGGAQDHAVHPWIRTLEWFSIAFTCYASDGARCFVSPHARALIEDAPLGDRLAAQTDRAVATQLALALPHLQIAQFVRVAEVTSAMPAVTLSIYLSARADSSIAAVVIFHPFVARASREIARGGAALTAREEEVAAFIAAGLPTKEIAARLRISVHTARHHTERVFAKLGIRSRAALAAMFASRGG